MGLWAVLAIWVIGIPIGAVALIAVCQIWAGRRSTPLAPLAAGMDAPARFGRDPQRHSHRCEGRPRGGAVTGVSVAGSSPRIRGAL